MEKHEYIYRDPEVVEDLINGRIHHQATFRAPPTLYSGARKDELRQLLGMSEKEIALIRRKLELL